MLRGGRYEVVFGPSVPGMIGGGEVLGFRGPGERKSLSATQRREKRARNKRKRRAVRRQSGQG